MEGRREDIERKTKSKKSLLGKKEEGGMDQTKEEKDTRKGGRRTKGKIKWTKKNRKHLKNNKRKEYLQFWKLGQGIESKKINIFHSAFLELSGPGNY